MAVHVSLSALVSLNIAGRPALPAVLPLPQPRWPPPSHGAGAALPLQPPGSASAVHAIFQSQDEQPMAPQKATARHIADTLEKHPDTLQGRLTRIHARTCCGERRPPGGDGESPGDGLFGFCGGVANGGGETGASSGVMNPPAAGPLPDAGLRVGPAGTVRRTKTGSSSGAVGCGCCGREGPAPSWPWRGHTRDTWLSRGSDTHARSA